MSYLTLVLLFLFAGPARATTWQGCAQEHNKARGICDQAIQDAGAGIGGGQTGTKAATRDMSSRLAQKHKQAADRCREAARQCDNKCEQAAKSHKQKNQTVEEQNARNIKNGSCKHEHSKADNLQKQADGYSRHAQGAEGSRQDSERQKMSEKNSDGEGQQQGGQQGGGGGPPPGGQQGKPEEKNEPQRPQQGEQPRTPKQICEEQGKAWMEVQGRFQCVLLSKAMGNVTSVNAVSGRTAVLGGDGAESADGVVNVPLGKTPSQFAEDRGLGLGAGKKELAKAALHPLNAKEPAMLPHDHADFIAELIEAGSFCAADKEIKKLEAGDVQAQHAAKGLRARLAEKLEAADQPSDEFGLELTCNQ